MAEKVWLPSCAGDHNIGFNPENVDRLRKAANEHTAVISQGAHIVVDMPVGEVIEAFGPYMQDIEVVR